MTHEATILNESLNRGRKSGKITILDTEIEFYDEEVKLLSMPLKDVKITHGGTGNRYIFFTHPDLPGWTISTDDKSVLNHAGLKRDEQRRKEVGKIKNKFRLFWAAVYSLVALVVLTVLMFYLFRGAIVEQVAQAVPVTWEQDISESMLESATAGRNVVNDPNIQAQLAKITDPLVNAVENKDFKFSFTIIEDETLNAYALPGGAIVIHSGLILKADRVNEVAGVLAHEISHVTRRHHVRGMVDKLGFFVLLRAMLGDAAGIGTELAVIGTSLESLKYSRDYETEADESGWELMLRANLDPTGMIDFFEKLEHEHEDMPDIPEFMSTHPGTTERIKVLKEKSISGMKFDEIDLDFDQFKENINTYFQVNDF